jgi:outer membrane protein OmpA-like peptidoglycan-associated protein
MSRNWVIRMTPVLASWLLLGEQASASWYGVSVQGGTVNVSSSKADEIDKNGSAIGGMLFYRDTAPLGHWTLGLGMQSADVDGDNSSRGIKQEYNIISPFVDLRYLFDIGSSGFSAGLSIRNQFGKGAKYAVRDVETWDHVFAVGAVAQYTWFKQNWLPSVSLSVYSDVNNPDRRVLTTLLGFAVAVGSSPAPAPQSEPVKLAEAPAPAPTPEPAPAPTPPPAPQSITVSLDAKSVNFDLSKATLKPHSAALLKRLAAALLEHDEAWGGLDIAGHTDVSGREESNQKLSQARAQTVCDLFVSSGIRREKLRCAGYGSSRLLPGLERNSPEHRRVELEFKDIKPELSVPLKASIDKALQP